MKEMREKERRYKSMGYPLNVKKFCEVWCKETERNNQDEKEFAEAMANEINKAYYAGVEEGKRRRGK